MTAQCMASLMYHSSTLSKQHPMASLLSLPAEIRNRIWELCVVTQPRDGKAVWGHYIYPIKTSPSHSPSFTAACRNDWKAAAQPPLTKICRQVRHEALPMFYSMNMFTLQLRSDANRDRMDCFASRWLKDMGRANQEYLEHVEIRAWWNIHRTGFRPLLHWIEKLDLPVSLYATSSRSCGIKYELRSVATLSRDERRRPG